MTITQRFPIDSRVRLIAAPEIAGRVIGHDGDNVKVYYSEFEATGTHSPDAIERAP